MNYWNARRPRRKRTPTLDEALDRYLDEVSPTKRSIVQERSIARQWRRTRLARRTLESISNAELSALRDEWLQTLKPATVVRRLALLSHVYTVARKEWGFPKLANPVQLVTRPTVDDARDRRLLDGIRLRGIPEDICPRDELTWLIESTESRELPTIMVLAADTSMRRSEILSIQRENVNLQRDFVRLRQTKNGRPRDVPLSPRAREALRRFLVGRPLRGAVFSMTGGAVTRAFIRACRRARERYEAMCRQLKRRPHPAYFQDLRFHDLRHEGTSQLATALDMHELAKTNGNRDTRMLLRYYHPDPGYLSRKIARSPFGRRQQQAIREGRLQLDRHCGRYWRQRLPALLDHALAGAVQTMASTSDSVVADST